MKKKIEWAPIFVPMKRRLQTFAAAIWIFLMLFGELFSLLTLILIVIFGNIHIKFLLIIYGIYCYLDRDAVAHGAKSSGINWIRDNFYWNYFRDYFPVNLVKTVDLPPNTNYLFAVFPHGILSCGVFGNFVSNAPNFRKLFPGIQTKVLTLNMHFKVPIWRELLFSWGLAPASAECIQKILSAPTEPNYSYNTCKQNNSTAAVIVVGGAKEAFNARPNNYQLVIKNRKGFIKLAIKTGSPIVPVFSFGEVDIFEQESRPIGSLVRKFQQFIQTKTGIAPAIFSGRGFLQYSFGLIPQRRPITTVVGAPIIVKKMVDPTSEEIDKVHTKFMMALGELFNNNKEKYLQNSENIELIME